MYGLFLFVYNLFLFDEKPRLLYKRGNDNRGLRHVVGLTAIFDARVTELSMICVCSR